MRLNEMSNKTIVTILYKTNKFSWLNESNSQILDYEFYYNHSGEKIVTPIIDSLLEDGKTEEEVLTILANIMIVKYADKWNRLYDTFLNTKYDVFNDYKKTSEKNANVNQNVVNSSSGENGIYGFNSDTAVGRDTSSSKSTTTQDKSSNTANSTEEINGKIGSNSYQDLARKEIDLRMMYNFIDIFFHDISSELCLSIY